MNTNHPANVTSGGAAPAAEKRELADQILVGLLDAMEQGGRECFDREAFALVLEAADGNVPSASLLRERARRIATANGPRYVPLSFVAIRDLPGNNREAAILAPAGAGDEWTICLYAKSTGAVIWSRTLRP